MLLAEGYMKSLKMFMKNDNGSTLIDLVNKAIDDRLAKRLTRWCRSKKKLIVGSAEYKKIIERNLKITCTNVGVPHDEVVSGPKNPIGTLLPEETSELTKNDHHPMREEIVMFLHQHNIDMKPEMVDKYVVDTLHHLHRIELRENEHLKFFRILLQGFMVILGIDTTNWSLIQFATVPKMICHPTASYQISHPDEIFSDDENLKIEAIAPDYKKTFKKIDPLSVYDDVFSLHTEKTVTLADLCIFVMEAERAQEKADVIRLREDHSLGEPNMTDLPTTDSCQLEAPNSAESKQQVILNQTCISEVRQCLIPDKVQEKLAANMDGVERNMQARDNDVQSMDHYAKKLTASAFDLLGNKKDEHTGTSVTEMNLHGNLGDDGKKKQSGGTEGIRDTSMSSKSGGTEGIRDTSMSSKSESNKQKDVIYATSDIPKSGPLKDLNGDGKKPTASTLARWESRMNTPTLVTLWVMIKKIRRPEILMSKAWTVAKRS